MFFLPILSFRVLPTTRSWVTTILIFFHQLLLHSLFPVARTLKMAIPFVLPKILQPKIAQLLADILNNVTYIDWPDENTNIPLFILFMFLPCSAECFARKYAETMPFHKILTSEN